MERGSLPAPSHSVGWFVKIISVCNKLFARSHIDCLSLSSFHILVWDEHMTYFNK